MSKELESLKNIEIALAKSLSKQTGLSVKRHFELLQCDTEIGFVSKALTELEELKRDVNRYFELQGMWKWERLKEWTDEIEAEYEMLRGKLKKVGNEE